MAAYSADGLEGAVYLLSQVADRAAQDFPNKEAFRFGEDALTYGRLLERSNRLARALHDLGVRRGDRVGIFLHKSLETAVAVYGVMRAGAAYVPLDPRMPLERLAFVLGDCGIRVMITGRSQSRVLGNLISTYPDTAPVLLGVSSDAVPGAVAHDWTEIESLPATSPAMDGMEQDVAYVLYTSGSTGEPKGLIHTHASGLSYARRAVATYGVTHEDRLSNFPPLHFDQSTFDYLAGPLAGATTVVIPEAYAKLPASLSGLIERERMTIWYSVPFALLQLLFHGALEQRDLSSLRWVKFGGEPFPPKHLRALQRLLPQARFSNVYGPAEVNQCTYYHVPSPDRTDDHDAVPIGRIWENAEGFVVDSEDGPVGPEEVGELLVRTPTMMQGYWNRPDLNAGAFYHRAGAGGTLDRFYRTGDLVRRRPDGELHFVGRRDRQVKTRGYRVELDAVEIAILAHPAVEEAAVFTVPEATGTLRVDAAVVVKVGLEVDDRGLRQHLSTRLPGYAVPATVSFRSDFPRSPNGKIDRRALQAQALAAAGGMP